MGAYNNNTIPVRPPFRKIEIQLNWEDGIGIGGKSFSNVQEFAEFLKANPEYAKGVGYVAKEKKK
jgi:hypothetical protein